LVQKEHDAAHLEPSHCSNSHSQPQLRPSLGAAHSILTPGCYV